MATKTQDKKQVKRLYRNTQDKVLGGVCSGIGEYFGVDPVLVRVIYILATCLTAFFPLIIAYIVLWIIVPEKN